MFKPTFSRLAVACAAALTFSASALADITSINLSSYTVAGIYGLDLLGTGGAPSGLEGSAITYARDRNSLFYVGDEGTGVIEISRTGQTLSSMAFAGGSNLGWPTASTNRDSEGLTYLGGGVLVVAEERLYDAFKFTYVGGGSVNLATADFVSISNAVVGNNGLEGISYDPRGAGSFVTVKQQSPKDILGGTLTFLPAGGASTMTQLFNPNSPSVNGLASLTSLSDVQTLSPMDALVGMTAADNLLVLSLGSRQLVEINRAGVLQSSFDLTNILPNNAIEGVAVDQFGTIFLIAEQDQTGGAPPNSKSQLIVLVPEPGSTGLLLAGLGALGTLARRRKAPQGNAAAPNAFHA